MGCMVLWSFDQTDKCKHVREREREREGEQQNTPGNAKFCLYMSILKEKKYLKVRMGDALNLPKNVPL